MVLVWEDSGGNNIYTNFWGIKQSNSKDMSEFHSAIMQIGRNIFLIQKKNNKLTKIKNIKDYTSNSDYNSLYNISFDIKKTLTLNASYYPNYYLFSINNNSFEIDTNGAFLSNNPSKNVLIEGNTDNRGTNEYNMALGERRALSAKKYLIELGVSEGRIRTISYGEERPLFLGGSEDDSTYNRRDDFILE